MTIKWALVQIFEFRWFNSKQRLVSGSYFTSFQILPIMDYMYIQKPRDYDQIFLAFL